MTELENFQSEQMNQTTELNPLEGSEILKIDQYSAILPEKPWMPTHSGLEIRVSSSDLTKQVTKERLNEEKAVEELKKIGAVAVISAGIAEVFSEADDPQNPDWFDKPWFNLNFNSHLGGQEFSQLTSQVYLRARTLGQSRGMKNRTKYQERGDEWNNPYWAVPIPVDYPINPQDRQPYSQELQTEAQNRIHLQKDKISETLNQITLFTEPDGTNTLLTDFPFEINKGNYPVWQKGDYLLVTQGFVE